MPDGYCSSVWIESWIVVCQSPRLRTSKCLCGKRFVEFDDIHIVHRQPRFFKSFVRSFYWTNSHNSLFDTDDGRTNDWCPWLEVVFFHGGFQTYDCRCGSVIQSR